MGVFGWVIVLFGIAVAIGIVQFLMTSEKQNEMRSTLAKVDDFSPTQQVMGDDGNTGLAIDEKKQKVALIKILGGALVVDYKDVISCEIFEDGSTITKTIRSSQIGGALVGGIALGGVGAIIGGLSGKTKTDNKVKRVDLRLIINNTASPLHDIVFMNFECDKNTMVYQTAIKNARHWHGLMEVLIKRADIESSAQHTPLPIPEKSEIKPASVADELRKLLELRDAGVLTDSEFQQQKSKVLG